MATRHPLSVVVCRPAKQDSVGKGGVGEFESTRTIATIASTSVLGDCVGQKQLIFIGEVLPMPLFNMRVKFQQFLVGVTLNAIDGPMLLSSFLLCYLKMTQSNGTPFSVFEDIFCFLLSN